MHGTVLVLGSESSVLSGRCEEKHWSCTIESTRSQLCREDSSCNVRAIGSRKSQQAHVTLIVRAGDVLPAFPY